MSLARAWPLILAALAPVLRARSSPRTICGQDTPSALQRSNYLKGSIAMWRSGGLRRSCWTASDDPTGSQDRGSGGVPAPAVRQALFSSSTAILSSQACRPRGPSGVCWTVMMGLR
jgi:hypothetical protein